MPCGPCRPEEAEFELYSKFDEMPHATANFKEGVSIVFFLKNQYG